MTSITITNTFTNTFTFDNLSYLIHVSSWQGLTLVGLAVGLPVLEMARSILAKVWGEARSAQSDANDGSAKAYFDQDDDITGHGGEIGSIYGMTRDSRGDMGTGTDPGIGSTFDMHGGL